MVNLLVVQLASYCGGQTEMSKKDGKLVFNLTHSGLLIIKLQSKM